ncbi:hypothetical protein DL768_006696 [Monosporascus sp. mg162]|nr:hypothetical protein DL768_006696 [Monosporascus sp. mg162]
MIVQLGPNRPLGTPLGDPAYVATTSILTRIVPSVTPIAPLPLAPGTRSDLSLDDFLSWNPGLASIEPCYLQEGYNYCAIKSSSAIPADPSSGLCLDADAAYPGAISTCDCFTAVTGADANYTYCAKVADDANISLSDLTSWNPWVGSDCDTGLFKGLADAEERAVCIGVNSTGILSTTTFTGTKTSTGNHHLLWDHHETDSAFCNHADRNRF